jgi:hypothetical protein
MGFVVTEEMAREFGKALVAAYKRAGTNLQEDRLKVMQEFIDRHNLAPASAVEEVELTHSEWLRLWTTVGRADEGKLAQAGKSYLASLGLRIVRDAKPVPADQSPHHAGVVPTTVPTSITFTETTAGVYNYSGGPFKNEGGGYLPEHFKVPAKIEAANVVIRQDGGEPEPLPDCLIQRFNQLSIRISALEATVDSLDSGQTEPKTVAAERTFTEAEVLAAMKYADERSATTISFARNFAGRLGIDMEANKGL